MALPPAWLLVMLIFATTMPLVLLGRRRIRKRWRRAGGLLCPYCHYDLSAAKGTTDVGEVRCPECGHLWDAHDVRSYWRHELGP
jgi:predicted Zn finger-like uncharacterized protein